MSTGAATAATSRTFASAIMRSVSSTASEKVSASVISSQSIFGCVVNACLISLLRAWWIPLQFASKNPTNCIRGLTPCCSRVAERAPSRNAAGLW